MIKSGEPELGKIGEYLLNKKAIEALKDYKPEEIVVIDDLENTKISTMLKKIEGRGRVLVRVSQYDGKSQVPKFYSLSVPQNAHIFSVKDQIRAKYEINPKQSIVLFVNNEVIHNFMSLKEIFQKYGKKTGYVNMLFISLQVFG